VCQIVLQRVVSAKRAFVGAYLDRASQKGKNRESNAKKSAQSGVGMSVMIFLIVGRRFVRDLMN
jgi:hypothetical protein